MKGKKKEEEEWPTAENKLRDLCAVLLFSGGWHLVGQTMAQKQHTFCMVLLILINNHLL